MNPTAPDRDTPLSVLRERFGHDEFREGQRDVLDCLLAGRSALAVFPTGGGKSLCYQLPSQIIDGLTLVVSPLTALMKDQIDALARRDIDAARLDSTLSFHEVRSVNHRVQSGELRLLYVTPERFLNERFRASILRIRVGLFAVDEAHCISEWGHNFRPDYLKLAAFARECGAERVLGLTATATPQVQRDVSRAFGIAESDIYCTGFHRPNLTVLTTPVPPARRETILADGLRRRGVGPSIVYVTLQRTAERIAAYLKKAGLPARAYHAGMDADKRRETQEWFMASSDGICVATIAFGMGIDKPDIRQVWHYNLPKSLENFSQEIGRAGRDGEPATCETLVTREDLRVLENFAYGDTPSRASIRAFVGEIFEAGDELALSLWHLSSDHDIRQLVVRTLLVYLELDGFLEAGTPFYSAFRVRWIESREDVIERLDVRRAQFLTQIFDAARTAKKWTHLDAHEIALKLGCERDRILRALDWLEGQGAIELQCSGVRQRYTVLRRPADLEHLVDDLLARVEAREAQEIARIEDFLRLVEHDACQVALLGAHFGDPLESDCGRCTWCRGDGSASLVERESLGEISEDDWHAASALREEYPKALGENRAFARFLCGLASPATTRAKLGRHDLFGIFGTQPFPLLLERIASSS